MSDIKKKIILAEPDADISDILTKLLKSWGYEAAVAEDGEALLDIVRKKHPSLILVDAVLPKIDGLEICKRLKEDFLTSHIPLILLIEKRTLRKKMLEFEHGVDDYVLKPPDPIDLEIKIEMAIRRTDRMLFSNPLTRLPSGMAIEYVVDSRIKKGRQFSLAYCDINNFKSYNDKYGYIKGNMVIQQTAHILSSIIRKTAKKDGFVGHIGGDDFVIIIPPGKEDMVAFEVIMEFDRLMPFYYERADRQKGSISIKNREGNIVDFPLMSLSIAIVNNKNRRFDSYLEIGEATAEIKSYLKSLKGSNFLVDRRVNDQSRESYKRNGKKMPLRQRAPAKMPPVKKIKPLGQILLETKLITENNLNEAIKEHLDTYRKLGEVLIEMGVVSPEQIGESLARQRGIPLFDRTAVDIDKDLFNSIPSGLMREFKFFPINKKDDQVAIAMADPFDNPLITELETKLNIKIKPYLVFDDVLNQILKNSGENQN